MAMTLPVKASRDFERVSAGPHTAICNMIVDAGVQPGSVRYPKPYHQIYFRFEVPDQRVEYEHNGKKIAGPMTIGIWYRASMSAKSFLRKHLEGWRGINFSEAEAASFDLEKVLGKTCTLIVTQNKKGDKTYSNIMAIAAAPKGVALKAENPLILYTKDSPREVFDKLPPWLQERIENQAQTEPAASDNSASSGDSDGSNYQPWTEEDIPF